MIDAERIFRDAVWRMGETKSQSKVTDRVVMMLVTVQVRCTRKRIVALHHGLADAGLPPPRR